MIRPTSILLLFAAAVPLAGCTNVAAPVASAQGSSRQCFLARQVHGFGNATDQSIDVWVNASNYYRLDLIGPCHDINWSTGLILRSTSGSDWICQGADAEIIVPGPIAGRCLVSGVHPITKAQFNARPPR